MLKYFWAATCSSVFLWLNNRRLCARYETSDFMNNAKIWTSYGAAYKNISLFSLS